MHNPHYRQRIDTCFEDAVGEGGLSSSDYHALLSEAEPALERLRAAYKDRTLALLRVPERTDDLAPMRELAGHLMKDTSDLFVLGTGGSSLGAQALAQLTGWGTPGHRSDATPRIHFLDNLDAVTMQEALARADLRTTRFLVVSKSGGTVETLMQMLAVMSMLKEAGGEKYLKYHFGVITEPPKNGTPNALRKFAESLEIPCIDHDPGVGGRFSVLTNVGLLPALLFGLDVEKIREGAQSVLEPVFDGKPAGEVAPAVGAALSLGLQRHKGADISVFLGYGDRFERLISWHLQLWAESLGKEGHGTTPVKALGPVDQHSQLQLYLAGPKDKMYSVFMTDTKGKGPEVSADFGEGEPFSLLSGHRIGDLVDAEQRATADTLARNGRPVRVFDVATMDEATMGALMMHFMLETIIAGEMLSIDPFDQPAVEEGKVLAKKYLSEG